MQRENLEDKSIIGPLSEDLAFNIVFFLKPIEVLLINKIFYSFSRSPHYWHTLIQRDFGKQLITPAALSLHTEEEYQAIYKILFKYQYTVLNKHRNEILLMIEELNLLIKDFRTKIKIRLNLSETPWLFSILTELSSFLNSLTGEQGFLFYYKSAAAAEAKIPVPLATKGQALSYKNFCQESGVENMMPHII